MSPATVRAQMKRIERQARIIRQRAGLGEDEPVDALKLQEAFKIRVTYPKDVDGMPEADSEALGKMDASVWSGMGLPLSSGELLVILNPNQTPERARVTALEEVAHRHYNHPPSRLDGVSQRDYNDPVEKEAYWTAAAVMLPAKVVARAVYRKESAEDLGRRYGASIELVEMRIKLLGFWSDYRRSAGNVEAKAS